MKTHRTRGMTWCVGGDRGEVPYTQRLSISQPLIGSGNGDVGHLEKLALQFQILPERLIGPMQAQRRSGRLMHLSGGQKVIEMSVCMDDEGHRQVQVQIGRASCREGGAASE